MVKSSTKPDAWTLSPQMTAAPELWRGCYILAALWESAGGFQNLVWDGPPINGTSTQTSGITWDRSEDGVVVNSTAIATDNSGTLPSESVISGFVFWDNLSNSTPEVFRYRDIDNAKNLFEINAGSDHVIEVSSESGFDNGDIAGAVMSGKNVISWTAVAGGACDVYLNGVFQGNRSVNWSSVSTGVIIEYNFFGNDINMAIAGMWNNRRLTDGDHWTLGNDPFAMLRPAGF